jgi:hypothetical protein
MPAGVGGTGPPGTSGGWFVINTGTSSHPHIVIDFANTGKEIENRYPGKPVMGPWPTEEYARVAAEYLASLYQVGVNVAQGARGEAKIMNTEGGAISSTLDSGPFAGLGAVIQTIDTFFHALTDPTMWRSLAWLFLGIALLIIGIGLWLKNETPIGKLV